ncbi:hypothetical protein PsAD2_03018 [Pseudovibrio axinellae]|uniref:Phage DNA packaging protein Nu1 n=1 Tax=Pseudovibrio axinellae TaxID=989403 RepID=A0A165XGH3_9HYPH|nr:hypothetical protein [Pseudovibrio axinellae]KZL17681.1 hypothetical protein PsAD2_03018 [Pseudovibrio axinellae]SER43820.1 hypothetical protein SAMN05421798_11063 [Pseudovibrio axinellae]
MATKTPKDAKAKKIACAKRAAPANSKLPEMVGSGEMAKFLDITPRRLGQLVSEGVLRKEGRGKFPLTFNVKAFIDFKVQGEVSKLAPNSADKLAQRREQALVRKMAREDRELITIDEAMEALEDVTGEFLTSMSTLPAQITRDLDERRRIEKICDGERSRLVGSFLKTTKALQQGSGASEAKSEDDAG